MAVFLGIDTSNYTTSCALWCREEDEIFQQKQLLPVKPGEIGLRQSDAVFAHVKQLGPLMEELLRDHPAITAVGVSRTPRDEEGSYMPCFLAGEMAARSVAAALGAPLYGFSHQGGHVAAALYATGNLEWVYRPFLAFHVSGGTTQCLLVRPGGERLYTMETMAQSLDLHAGQAVDRVGALLGLSFPAGPELEKLALLSDKQYSPKPTLKGADCCLSGLENQCAKRLDQGERAEDVARYCLDYLAKVLLAMTGRVLEAHPGLPLLYAGGVMSNTIIRQRVEARYQCSFAPPAFSTDNGAGIAVLAGLVHEENEKG